MKLLAKIMIVLCIIVAIVLSVVIYHIPEIMYRYQDIQYKYEVKIDANTTNDCTILVPIPIEIRDNNIGESKMIEEITVAKGNATFSTIETEKGLALNITFRGNVVLKASGTKRWEKWAEEDYDYDILSLQNVTNINDYYHGRVDVPYWVFYDGIENNETISLEINVYFGNVHDEVVSSVKGDLTKNGWQILYGTQRHTIE